MRCLSCNDILSDREATRKYPSGEFIDLCDFCIKEIDIPFVESMSKDNLNDEESET